MKIFLHDILFMNIFLDVKYILVGNISSCLWICHINLWIWKNILDDNIKNIKISKNISDEHISTYHHHHPNMPGETKIPFVSPTFSWDSPNLYSNYKLFKQKVEITFKGQFKDWQWSQGWYNPQLARWQCLWNLQEYSLGRSCSQG